MRSNTFDFGRLGQFIRRQVTLYRQPAGIAAGAVLGFMLVVSLLVASFAPETLQSLRQMYGLVFYLAGLVLTSMIFAELHTPQRGYAYLTLPVSASEKLLGSWLLSAPVYVIGYWICVLLIYALSCAVANITAGYLYPPLEIFSEQFPRTVGSFLVIQTIFFLGAVYFRKNNFLKTVFALFLVAVVIGLYVALLLWLLIGQNKLTDSGDGMSYVMNTLFTNVLDGFLTFILGPFLLLVSYFRLKERQI
jgi:hypothetical protein